MTGFAPHGPSYLDYRDHTSAHTALRLFVHRDGTGCLGHVEQVDGRYRADDGNHTRTFPTSTQAVNALRRGLGSYQHTAELRVRAPSA